jgi:hypothetical protein
MTARWPAGWHPAMRAGTQRQRGLVVHRAGRVPMERFTRAVQGVPLTGGQAQGVVPGSGTITLKVGPQGLGNVWYPVQCVVSTTTGALDTSTCAVYLGSQAQQNLQGGQSYSGGGDTVALAVVSMSPGDLLIAIWAGAVPGAVAAFNVQGTMDALAY